MLNEMESHVSILMTGAVSVWFFFWPLRRKYELDYPLDRSAQVVRWLVVGVFFLLALNRRPDFTIVRIVAAVVSTAFLAWPNFAYRLTQLFRRLHGSQKGD